MERLKVCGRFETPQFAERGYTHMVSIGDSDDFFEGLRLPEIAPANHLCLRFTDTEDASHPDAPKSTAISPLFDWLSGKRIGGLLVHCAAGISRSPAIALLAACHLDSETDPLEHMGSVAKASECSYIWPNRLVVVLGDSLLKRGGAVVRALEEWRRSQDDQPIEFV